MWGVGIKGILGVLKLINVNTKTVRKEKEKYISTIAGLTKSHL